MKIRNARLRDLGICASIGHIPEFSYLYKATNKESNKYLKDFLRNGIFIDAEENNSVIGFLIAEFMLGNFVWLDGIVVTAKYRSRGVGAKLFHRLVAIVKQKGKKHIYLMAPKLNIRTKRFYKSVGMKKGKEFIEFTKEL